MCKQRILVQPISLPSRRVEGWGIQTKEKKNSKRIQHSDFTELFFSNTAVPRENRLDLNASKTDPIRITREKLERRRTSHPVSLHAQGVMTMKFNEMNTVEFFGDGNKSFSSPGGNDDFVHSGGRNFRE